MFVHLLETVRLVKHLYYVAGDVSVFKHNTKKKIQHIVEIFFLIKNKT